MNGMPEGCKRKAKKEGTEYRRPAGFSVWENGCKGGGRKTYHLVMVAFNEIENVARRIGEKTHAKAVVLFGSHARNQAGAHSDVDLLVIAESDLPRHKRSRQLHLLFKPYPFAMDILVYTPEEVEAESQFELSFISRVLREGKRLYGQTV